MNKHLTYFLYVLRHKKFVWQEGRRLGVPAWQLVLHDWDKFLPEMFEAYAENFYGPSAVHERERIKKIGSLPAPMKSADREAVEERFRRAAQSHLLRNKHHWEYWANRDEDVATIPPNDLKEILADWEAMARAQKSTVWAWYGPRRWKIMLSEIDRAWLEAHMSGQAPNGV